MILFPLTTMTDPSLETERISMVKMVQSVRQERLPRPDTAAMLADT